MENFTLTQLYRHSKSLLEKNDIPDADFDSLCLMEHFFNADRSTLIIHGDRLADSELCRRFLIALNERISGRPLQYIIGKWNFMGLDFFVGEGVLIPRSDTEITAEKVIALAQKMKSPKIIDLCSGSGAIAVSVAKFVPDAQIVALELSEDAFVYLQKNIKFNSVKNVTPVLGDVTKNYSDFSDETFDIIVSNPPYIKTNQIDTLQPELAFEPRMALDGGDDGIFFYKIISKKWKSKLKIGGFIVYETGEDEHEPVKDDLIANGYSNISYLLDLQGFKRTTFANR